VERCLEVIVFIMRPPLLNAQRWGPLIGLVVALIVGFVVFYHPMVLWIMFLIGIAAFLIGIVFVVFFDNIYGRVSDRRREPVPIPALGGKLCAIRLEGYTWDKRKGEFDAAITNFLSLDATALKEAEGYVFQYYKDCEQAWKSFDDEFKPVKSPSDIWKHVGLGGEPRVFRSRTGDKEIYISISCGCDWEPEHGMEIVFKDGRKLVKVGPCDGNPTNTNAAGNDSLETPIYKA
jgi:hypothetical protein